MSELKEIIIDIMEDGSVHMEGKGFKGPECEKFINELSAAFGGRVTKSLHKPEYFQTATKSRKLTR